jgi:hypothetical protein
MEREKRNNPLLKKFNDKENIINEKKSTSSTRTTNPNLQTIAESQQTT